MGVPLIWAEVDLNAIAHNICALRRIIDPSARLLAAVKTDAYGHGDVQVARTALENGADVLGVARVEEGAQLREAGIRAPVYPFTACTPPMRWINPRSPSNRPWR